MKLAMLALACALVCAAPARAADLNLETLDGPTAVKLMDEGKLTSVELTRAYIARIAALNKSGPGLNAPAQQGRAQGRGRARQGAQGGARPRSRPRPPDPAQGFDRREGPAGP